MLLPDFFKAVKKRSPLLFYFFLFFSVFQVLFTFMKLEVAPLLLYGMYSEKIPRQTEFKMMEIYVNDSPLSSLQLNSWQKDILYTTYENYAAMQQNNNTDIVQTRVEQRYHFLTSSFIYPSIKGKIYNTRSDMNDFVTWYRAKFQQFLKAEIKTIRIYSFTCTFDRLSFTFHKQPLSLIAEF